MPELNPKQFPVLREEFTSDPAFKTDMDTPLKQVRFTSVDRESGRPASFATYYKSRWKGNVPRPGSADDLFRTTPQNIHVYDTTRGEDVPMFTHEPAVIESMGTHSDYRRGGEALRLINHAVDEMWRTGEVPEGQIPEISTELSTDSVGMYEQVTGKDRPEDTNLWTDKRQRMDTFSDGLLDRDHDVRPSTMDDIDTFGPVRRPDYTAAYAPEPSSTVEEKLERVKAPKEKAPRRKKGPDLQMTLPGV